MSDRLRPPVPLPPVPTAGQVRPAGAGRGHPPLPPARALPPQARRGGRGPADPGLPQRPPFGMRFAIHLFFFDPDRDPLAIDAGSAEPGLRDRPTVLQLPSRGEPLMLPEPEPGPTAGRLRRRPADPGAARDHLAAGPVSSRPGARGGRRTPALPLQAARSCCCSISTFRTRRARRPARDPAPPRATTGSYPPEDSGVSSAVGPRRPTGFAGSCGADDYVVKPFRSRSRRHGSARCCGAWVPPRRPLRVGELVVDPRGARFGSPAEPVRAREQGIHAPAHARERPSRVFTKDELLRDAWGFRSLAPARLLRANGRFRRR